MDIETCLTLLELEPPLSPASVQRAYRRQVRRWHPDQFSDQPAVFIHAETHLKALNQAYAILKRIIADNEEVPAGSNQLQRTADRQRAGLGPKPPASKPTTEKTTSDKKNSGPYIGRQRTAPQSQKRKPRATPTSGKTPLCFQAILERAGSGSVPADDRHFKSTRSLSAGRPAGHRRKAMRVEGFEPASPIAPVRPVSAIKPIGESD